MHVGTNLSSAVREAGAGRFVEAPMVVSGAGLGRLLRTFNGRDVNGGANAVCSCLVGGDVRVRG